MIYLYAQLLFSVINDRLSLRGMTIILSIHQPRYSIFKLFDTMMLLSGGECVFYGPAKDALEYFRLGGESCRFLFLLAVH